MIFNGWQNEEYHIVSVFQDKIHHHKSNVKYYKPQKWVCRWQCLLPSDCTDCWLGSSLNSLIPFTAVSRIAVIRQLVLTCFFALFAGITLMEPKLHTLPRTLWNILRWSGERAQAICCIDQSQFAATLHLKRNKENFSHKIDDPTQREPAVSLWMTEEDRNIKVIWCCWYIMKPLGNRVFQRLVWHWNSNLCWCSWPL